MNTIQERTLKELRRDILLHDGLGERFVTEYEYKRWEVTCDNDTPLVFLLATVGRKTDEGTMGMIIGRTTRHIAIGAKGGVTLLNRRTAKNRWAKNISGYHNAIISCTSY